LLTQVTFNNNYVLMKNASEIFFDNSDFFI